MQTSPLKLPIAAASACSFLLAAPAWAAAAGDDRTPLNLPPAEPAGQAATGGGGGGIARMIVGLAVVLAVIYGLAWVLRQVRSAKEGTATGGGLAAIASLPLGPNRSVHLVRVGTDLVLVGVGEKGVTPIRAYREPEARAAGLLDADEPTAPPAAGGLLDGLRRRTVRR